MMVVTRPAVHGVLKTRMLDDKEGRVLKNRWFQIVVLEKTLVNPLDSKIKPVNPKGNQVQIFIRRTDVAGETLIL